MENYISDILDEAGSRARLQIMVVPPDLKEVEGEIENLKQEKESYIKSQDFEKAAKMRDLERESRQKLEKMNYNSLNTYFILEEGVNFLI